MKEIWIVKSLSMLLKENESFIKIWECSCSIYFLDKILIKILKANDKYSIVSNYTTDELRELGLTDSQIVNNKTLYVYDEIVLNPDLSKVE